MAQVLVRNLPDAVVRTLKRRAAVEGKSLEPFLRERLTRLAAEESEHYKEMARIAAMSPPIDDPEYITRLIREDRER